jgi:hypothetical protein
MPQQGARVRISGGLFAGRPGRYVGKSQQIPGGHKVKVAGGNIYHVADKHMQVVSNTSGQDDGVLGRTSGKAGGHAGLGR